MGFSRQEFWSGVPFPSPGDLPDPGIKPRPPTLQADAVHLSQQGSPHPGRPRSKARLLPTQRSDSRAQRRLDAGETKGGGGPGEELKGTAELPTLAWERWG